ncbi:MAG TPA: molybdopterin-dependent oxidoreductase [Gemmatimonadales bacterium]|nr:molybdopterin-dependent oxidoreductase [Gemmatimonadales bacterium]
MSDGMNRRRFLKILGVTGGGAAAVSACGIGPEPTEKLIPYLVQSDDQVPGIATWYASTCRECPAGCGILVKTREGRAIKIEGNPESPVNRGRLCARGQAALQGLYNPDRVTEPLARNAQGTLEKISWDDAMTRLSGKVRAAGKGLVFLTGAESSSFGDLVDEWTRSLGGRHVVYEPFGYEALREGNRVAFGTDEVPWYDFAGATYIMSFGADFLDTWVSPVGFQQGFAQAHGFDAGRATPMAKMVYVGPRMNVTGMNADEWIAAAPGTEGLLALAMAQVIVDKKLARVPGDVARVRELIEANAPDKVAALIGVTPAAITRYATEFAAGKAPLAVAGGMAAQYPNGAEIVAAVNLLNYVAGAVGNTVKFGADLASGAKYGDVAALKEDMTAGKVAVLLVHGANPAYSLGGGFVQAWTKVGYKVAFTTMLDETASAADLVLPDLHPIEQWNDSRPRAGVYALQQPAMQPVFPDTRAAGDVLLAAAGKPGTFKDYLQARWKELARREARAKSFDDFWNGALQHGGIFGEAPSRAVKLGSDAITLTPQRLRAPAFDGAATNLVCVVYPHGALSDGRGADKPWLQELPDPLSKITWHGWVEVHPDNAETWGLAAGDILQLESPFGTVRAPAWITRTIRPDVLAVPTGQGHLAYGRYARNRSFNAFDLLSGSAGTHGGRSFAVRVAVKRTGEHRFLATTEGTAREHGEEIVKTLGFTEAVALKPGAHPFESPETPDYAEGALEGWAAAQHEMASLGNYAGTHPRWAMAIDLSKCTGCSACVTACYAENNIATVGEDLVLRRREMSWMRIERYFRGGEKGEPVQAVITPMLCQQCGNAPCEPVCPVFAAYHTADGLNGQVYNRCVGTRYCANNCPYKVRYFNWFNFAEEGGDYEAWPAPLDWLLNPDVTVREKGVMEKCTFCVQRIRGAQNTARLEDRAVKDGEIVPACAQGCPSEAIIFGDLNDPASRVHALSENPRGYHVLTGLNTKPAITYLARVVHAGEA